MTPMRQVFVPFMLLTSAVVATSSIGWAGGPAPKAGDARAVYRVDAKKSRLIVETETGALSPAMFAHDHRIEVGEFSGSASFSPAAFSDAAFELTAKAGSLHLIGEANVGAREAVEAALREDVLEASKYPEISFKTKKVTSARRGDGTWDVRLVGELSLHGVKRPMTLPARVSLDGDTLHAIGVFEIRQTDFGITPFSFMKGGPVVIKDDVTLSFDLVAVRS